MARRAVRDDMFYGMTLTEEQLKFKDAVMDDATLITFCDAVAGSGKTTVALGCAAI